jgi:hypothetical protein
MTTRWIEVSVLLLVQGFFFFRWLYCRLRDDEITRAFVRDLALNHLPHIYSALRQLAEHEGITLVEPPLLRYVDCSRGEGKRRA